MQEARTDRRGLQPRLWGSCCVRSNVMRVGGILHRASSSARDCAYR